MPLVILAFVCLAILALALQFVRVGSILDRWAARNGYQIIERESRLVKLGPFTLNTSRGQVVYRVAVRDREGNVRKGYVRCGGALLGTLSNKIEVCWDDQPREFMDYPSDFPGGA